MIDINDKIRTMKKLIGFFTIVFFTSLPELISAQGVASDIRGLQSVLDTIYDQMLPLCSSLIGVGRAIAGFAAIWYISYRVWRHIASAEPIDFYPLFRPFVIGFAVLIFPSVIALINGILQPTVTATNAIVQNSDQAIAVLLQQKQQAIQNSDFWKMYVGPDGNGDRQKWYQYTHPDDPTGSGDGLFSGLGNDIKFAMAKMSYNIRNSIKEWMSESLEVLFEAAALCINTVRTFWLIVLAILGPLVFGLSVFGGLHHTLTVWIARYINVFLWLPVANIFGSIIGKIQENMIRLDINQIQTNGDTFFSSTDTGYLIFLIIGIFGYFTVPSIANHIVNAGGSNPLLFKVTNLFNSTVKATVSTASAGIGGLVNSFSDQGSAMGRPLSNSGSSNKSSSSPNNHPGSYMYNKLSGKVENQTDLKS